MDSDVFSIGLTQGYICAGQYEVYITFSRAQVGSNTSTVALLVVQGDKNGSLDSEIVKYGRESHGTRTKE
jgi:hypothetical protein